jgi:hypothetical protein
MPDVDDDLRQAVIEKMFQKPEDTEALKQECPPEVSPPRSDGVADLGEALEKVLTTRQEQAEKPARVDEVRQFCTKKIDKGLVRDMMGKLRR